MSDQLAICNPAHGFAIYFPRDPCNVYAKRDDSDQTAHAQSDRSLACSHIL